MKVKRQRIEMVTICRNLNKKRKTNKKRQKNGRRRDSKISNRVETGGRDRRRARCRRRARESAKEWPRVLIEYEFKLIIME